MMPAIKSTSAGVVNLYRLAAGGHRGMGENILAGSSHTTTLKWRENTILSMKQVLSIGANMVEFDVQVSKDGVPVIFHDDLIEWGTTDDYRSEPISSLSLSELKDIGSGGQLVRRTRDPETFSWLEERAPWRCENEDGLPALQELLQELPADAAFDLEVKMAVGDDVAVTPPDEIDRMLTPIVEIVKEFGGSRTIFFSSFDPDICVELVKRMKSGALPETPVLFLTSGNLKHPDPRRRSVKAAADFATEQGFAGVVADAEKLHDDPSLMALVKGRGLYLASYGLRNNMRQWVGQQVAAGVDAVITDRIEATADYTKEEKQ